MSIERSSHNNWFLLAVYNQDSLNIYAVQHILILKRHYAQFSLQNLGCTFYVFQTIAINNDK